MKGRNRDAGIEKQRVGTGREGEDGTNWDSRTDINTLPCVNYIASGNLPDSTGS